MSDSSCSGTLCGSLTFCGVARGRACARSRTLRAPVPPAGWARKTCHASPHQTVRLFVSRLPSRPGSFTTSPEPPSWSPAQVTGLPTLATSPSRPTDDRTTATAASEAAHDRSRRRVSTSRATGTLATSDEHDDRADDASTPSDRAVRDAIGASAAVLDERGPREGPAGDENAGPAASSANERRLDPARRQSRARARPRRARRRVRRATGSAGSRASPRRGAARRRAAEALAHRGDEPEAEAERGVGEERERVPVADRSLQPRDPAGIVRAERRDRLAEQRPARGRRRARRRERAPARARGARAGRRLRGRRRRRRGGRCPWRARPRSGRRRSTTRRSGRSTRREPTAAAPATSARAIEARQRDGPARPADERAAPRRSRRPFRASPSRPCPDAPPAKSAHPRSTATATRIGCGEA